MILPLNVIHCLCQKCCHGICWKHTKGFQDTSTQNRTKTVWIQENDQTSDSSDDKTNLGNPALTKLMDQRPENKDTKAKRCLTDSIYQNLIGRALRNRTSQLQK